MVILRVKLYDIDSTQSWLKGQQVITPNLNMGGVDTSFCSNNALNKIR